MSHTPHEIHSEFPEKAEAIHALKQSDVHFAKMADKYHQTNRAIHRIEAEVEAASDYRLEDLKKRRLVLLDKIAAVLNKNDYAA